VGGLFATLAKGAWRRQVWGWVARLGRWLGGVRLSTAAQRERQADQPQKQERVKRPRWAIYAAGNHKWQIVNWAVGTVASDVVVEAPAAQFTFMESPEWEAMNGYSMENFMGMPTKEGHILGIAFTIEWDDASGERQSFVLPIDGGGASAAYGVL
jgi:hypothetical protein